jgi:hypothetical protein
MQKDDGRVVKWYVEEQRFAYTITQVQQRKHTQGSIITVLDERVTSSWHSIADKSAVSCVIH